MAKSEAVRHSNVVCPGCTLLCDQIEVSICDGAISEVRNACPQCHAWLTKPVLPPSCLVDGNSGSLEQAASRTRELLSSARNPLICGLDGLTTEVQQLAFKIARKYRGTIDTTFSNRSRSHMFALQQVGNVTATLGEVRARTDLVVFWFCESDDLLSHFVERYCTGKHLIQVGATNHLSVKGAEFLEVGPGSVSNVLQDIRLLVGGAKLDSPWSALVEQLCAARYVSFVFGGGLSLAEGSTFFESAFSLTRELNDKTRCVNLSLRSDGNALSAENVLTWSCGYPFAVNFNSGEPAYNGLEFSAETTLEAGRCDAALVCSTLSLPQLSDRGAQFLKTIPKAVLSAHAFESEAEVRINSKRPGVDESGDWCRLDDAVLKLSDLVESQNVSSAEFLEMVLAD